MTTDQPKALGWLILPCRVILGGLFIFAGVLKLGEAQAFADAIKGFRIVGEQKMFFIPMIAFMLPWVEIVAGVLLVLGLWARGAALVIVMLLIAFALGVVSVIARDIDTKCSCFGDIEWPCSGGVGMCQVIRNAVLVALGTPVLIWGPGSLAIDRESKA